MRQHQLLAVFALRSVTCKLHVSLTTDPVVMVPKPQKMLSPSSDLLLHPKYWNQTIFGDGTKFVKPMMLDQERYDVDLNISLSQ